MVPWRVPNPWWRGASRRVPKHPSIAPPQDGCRVGVATIGWFSPSCVGSIPAEHIGLLVHRLLEVAFDRVAVIVPNSTASLCPSRSLSIRRGRVHAHRSTGCFGRRAPCRWTPSPIVTEFGSRLWHQTTLRPGCGPSNRVHPLQGAVCLSPCQGKLVRPKRIRFLAPRASVAFPAPFRRIECGCRFDLNTARLAHCGGLFLPLVTRFRAGFFGDLGIHRQQGRASVERGRP